MKDNIYLVGFMGCGKSAVGKKLSSRLGFRWIDLDKAIEEQTKMSIPAIFDAYGEPYFRKLEAEMLMEIANTTECVVSTGGGIVMIPSSQTILEKQYTIYLKNDFETIYERIVGDKNRPMVRSLKQVKTLYEMRIPLYEKIATHTIICDKKTIDTIAEEIIAAYKEEL